MRTPVRTNCFLLVPLLQLSPREQRAAVCDHDHVPEQDARRRLAVDRSGWPQEQRYRAAMGMRNELRAFGVHIGGLSCLPGDVSLER